ncbi:FAD-dependent oxidoreductase [Gallibacterium salpingitidis]|uniref:FAD-dependent oxidoreductase n=1 Tax=Gallibacterium salpingitidis TaxID=505341 RepID=A0A1A7PXL7_9PAST|nr:NAD(P)/FAD-dependent oxidoreductase [Gallibacterium salpingitidis]OBW96445.1 FAD-dependent oxidoreductase [Gallibacterium salpingitidis]OBX06462.1 FAD-dependent oxidoreductase [Gallibacterium salpingitidis]OBX08911.1 FAD-dependent oxidoreductase [Gallibacterium salpingitidis]WKS99400.1 NAD(P)/FAD-dependent oxidoreductase [Gallibacterium salpingitidis]
MLEQRKVVVIGAGPSGAIAATLLKRQGYDVLVLEKQTFPRFSIGESLLPHCLDFIEEAGMLAAVEAQGYQIKHGAAFALDQQYSVFDFAKQFTQDSKKYAYEVKRGEFDKLLADCAVEQGVEIRYQHEIVDIVFQDDLAFLTVNDLSTGKQYQLQTEFVLDGSGYGRVLARLLNLETPSNLPPRQAIFTHIEDNITAPQFERDKILISVHPQHQDIWFWLIPFSDGRSSIGVVGEPHYFASFDDDFAACLQSFVKTTPNLTALLGEAKWDTAYQKLTGYSANVKQLYGKNFALLGNSAEFLDPVFSSGVTIAMCSASLAVKALDRQFKGEQVDWQRDFADVLQRGVDTFRTYVMGWYDLSFQRAIFAENRNDKISAMISSILAGYAWDLENPYVKEHQRRLKTLAELCK